MLINTIRDMNTMLIKFKPQTIKEYSDMIENTVKDVVRNPQFEGGITDDDIKRVSGTTLFYMNKGLPTRAILPIILTAFFEKGYREGVASAEAKLMELDKKMEAV